MIAEENESDDEYGEDYGEESRPSSPISYHSEDFISKPKVSEDGTIPYNILEFDHSFGYDCRRRFNLCVADPDTLIFASGNLIHFFNVAQNILTFRRCSTSGGIGHITKNPTFDHIAIGENGVNPPIIIYEWPSMEIVTVLNEGTTRSFSYLRYSPDGLQLVSQGGDPDYLITVWDWQRSKIALQCKSHGQDIFNVVFSPTMEGQMTSCGAGHIKCWKMSKTFTGLKLQGELGRFGKTEISDIVGVYPMSDEKIISGCEWGNILVWNEGLIKIEVCRKNGRPCHESYISQFEFINGELISVGTDGYINVWYYETIDQAEPTENSHFIEVEPIYEFSIAGPTDGSNSGLSARRAMLMQILKQNPSDADNTFWYAQDGNGGIWRIELSTMQTPKFSEKLLTCHAGPIVDMETADWGPYAATIGQDGCLHVYNYQEKRLTLTYQFRDVGSCIVWLPSSVEPSGKTLVCGFRSGVVRMVSIDLEGGEKKDDRVAWLTQVVKPHTKKITRMTINPSNSILVTGSEDSTIFVFYIEISESYPHLVPIGYVEVPSSVTFLTWKPNHPFTIFVGCSEGDCVQVDLPGEPQDYTTISYNLIHCQPIVFKFESVKSSILREQARLEIEQRRQDKIAEKREELRIFKENNPGIDVDEEVFLEADMEEDVQLPEIYIPEVPSRVLVVFYTVNDTVVLSMAGYDAGYAYEYSNPEVDKETVLLRTSYVVDCEDEEIRSYLFYNDRKYVIFGMKNGEVRVCKVNPDDEIDFSDYWILPMHDNFNGYIPSIRLSYDQKMLLTCGHDGNIFSFTINDDSPVPTVEVPEVETTSKVPTMDVADIEELDYPSLEQVIVQTEENRIMANAKEEKQRTLAILQDLTEEYNLILKRNQSLPASQRLTEEELELDPRITEDLNEQLKTEMDLVHKKLAYNVEKSKLKLKKLMDHFIEPITGLPFAVKRILEPDTMVYSLRELKLTGDYAPESVKKATDLTNLCDDEDEQVDEQKSASAMESVRTKEMESDEVETAEGPTVIGLESFLKGLSPRTIQFHLGDEINQMLKKYRALKAKLEEQEEEWRTLQSLKPDPKAVNPEDEEAIEHAKNTIGDYKLKAALNLDDDVEKRPTVLSKYKQIISCRRKIHFRREDYNDKLRDLRKRKLNLEKEVTELIKKLKNIHTELPDEWVKDLPELPVIDYEVEFPEKNLEMESYTSTADRVKETKKRRRSSGALHVNVEDFDEEYEVLLLDESRFRQARVSHLGEHEARRFSAELKAIQCTVPEDVLAALDEAEQTDTKLEHEMKRVRAARKNHEQDQILNYVQRSYETFDEELNVLERERLTIIHESVYMDLFLLTMHQELIVLKRFESMENELSKKVDDTLKTKTTVTNKINKVTSRIEEKTGYIAKLQERIRDSTMRYLNSIAEDKYYIFLKKICKKKYKPPKRDDASSSSESSSSESSSDDDDDADDGVSEDSRDVAMMHMDESVCPEGCERELYDQAFDVREKRYDGELKIRDEQRAIELLQKELEALRKRLRVIEGELASDKTKLEAFLREKQRQLNDIDITVVLKMHQLQCFKEEEKAEIQNCIVFDKNKLSQLYARVGELQQETADQVAKHKNDKIHLHKMKADCETMKKELESLKQEIKKEMQQKFGQQVSLVTLYEAVLRRLIYDIKANTDSLIKFYDEKIKIVKSEYKQQLQILKNLIDENTEKLSFLTVLEEELLRLRKTLNTKIVSEEEMNKLETQYESDLHRLKIMLKNQEKQKEFVSNDIRALCNRSRNLVPLDQLKSKADKAGRRATMTLFGGKEKDLLKYQMLDNYSKDDVSTSNEGKEFLIDDADYYKKIIAIRHLLSQVTTVDETNTRATIAKMLREVTENLQRAGYGQEEIEKNLSDIINVSPEEHEYVQDLGKESIDSLSDMIYRYSTELREAALVQEIKQEVRDRLDDLFLNLGIEDEAGHIMHGLVSKLKSTGNVCSGLKYLLEKLPSDTDEETKAALRKHIKHTLLKVIKHIEIEGVESIEIKEEDFQ